jgi:hypothetical protein
MYLWNSFCYGNRNLIVVFAKGRSWDTPWHCFLFFQTLLKFLPSRFPTKLFSASISSCAYNAIRHSQPTCDFPKSLQMNNRLPPFRKLEKSGSILLLLHKPSWFLDGHFTLTLPFTSNVSSGQCIKIAHNHLPNSYWLPFIFVYKVVKIWPGQTVTCLHTNSPGHIWTTLYYGTLGADEFGILLLRNFELNVFLNAGT